MVGLTGCDTTDGLWDKVLVVMMISLVTEVMESAVQSIGIFNN